MKNEAIEIIKAISQLKSQDCVGGFYAVFEVDEAIVLRAKKYIKNLKKEKKNEKD